jgi:hypothetical protein
MVRAQVKVAWHLQGSLQVGQGVKDPEASFGFIVAAVRRLVRGGG